MFLRKSFIGVLALSFLMLAGSVSFGQVGKVTGRVSMLDADGKTQSVPGAKVTCYRTDTDQTCRSVETDKNGYFVIIGLPLGSRFILGVSGPNLEPTYVPERKIGLSSEDIEIPVVAGDGREATEEQVRSSATASTAGLSDEQKKAAEEEEKKRQEIISKNKKVEANNAVRERVSKDGAAAFNSGDFTKAVELYDEGYRIDPAFYGAAGYLNNKAISYKERGARNYNVAAKAGDQVKLAESRKALISDLRESLVTAIEARKLINSIDASDAEIQKIKKEFDEKNVSIIADSFSILAQLNVNLLDYNDPDEVRGEMLNLYRVGLATQTSNLNIMAGLSFALYMESNVGGNTALLQESLNYGSQFLKVADSKHKLREAVQPIMELIMADGLKPQPIK